MTTTNSRIIIVPASWVAYELNDDVTIEEVRAIGESMSAIGAPSVAMMEALVMVGKVKRVAAVHTFNAVNVDEEEENEEGGSPFHEGDE